MFVLRLRTLLLAGFVGMFVVGVAAIPASAHDELLNSAPASGATLDAVPDTVTLTFSAPLKADGVQLAVVDSKTHNVGDGSFAVNGPTVTQRLKSGLSAGEYRISYRVISTDGHPVSGTQSFTVHGSAHASAPSTSPKPSSAGQRDAQPRSAGHDLGWLWWIVAVVVLFGLVIAGAALRRLGGSGNRDGA